MTKNNKKWLIGVKSDSKSIYEVKKFISLKMKKLWPFIDIFTHFQLFFYYKLNISQNVRAMKKFFLACIFRIECLYTVPKIKFTPTVEMHLTFVAARKWPLRVIFELGKLIYRNVVTIWIFNFVCAFKIGFYNIVPNLKFIAQILKKISPKTYFEIYTRCKKNVSEND